MNNLLFYVISSGICLTLFVSVYQIFLRNNHRFNLCRFYLIASILLSFIIPSLSIDLGISPFFNFKTEKVLQVKTESAKQIISQNEIELSEKSDSAWNINPILIIGYTFLLFSLLFLIRFMYRFGYILFIHLSSRRFETDEGINLMFTDKTDNAFSFLGYIFINPLKFTDEEKRLIIDHEREHIRNFHSIDLILIELLIVYQWFNPFAYIARRKLIELHEFIADNGVIKKGADPYSYQNLLLSVVTSSCLPTAGNQLSAFITKKRIAMIGKPMKQTGNWVSFLILIPVAAILIIGKSACTQKNPNDTQSSKTLYDTQSSNITPLSSINEISSVGEKILSERSNFGIKETRLKDFFMSISPNSIQRYSVILKKDIVYCFYYYSTEKDDKLHASIVFNKGEYTDYNNEISFSYSGKIIYKAKKTGAYHLSVGNQTNKTAEALMVLALDESSQGISEVPKMDPTRGKIGE